MHNSSSVATRNRSEPEFIRIDPSLLIFARSPVFSVGGMRPNW
jgi:hypothetical protein